MDDRAQELCEKETVTYIYPVCTYWVDNRAQEMCEKETVTHIYPVCTYWVDNRAQELCEHGGGGSGLSFCISHSSPSLIGLTVYVDVKHHERRRGFHAELGSCLNREVGLGPHSLSHSSPVPNKPYGFCGRDAP